MPGGDVAKSGRDRFRGEDALTGYVREQCAAVIRGEFALREDAPVDVVHDTRVALRRLRSVVREFAALLALDDTELREVEEDLRWLAGLLSDIRDADVLGDRLLAQVAALPPELVLGDVATEITDTLAEVRVRTVAFWQEQRHTDRFRAALRLLALWYDRPPVAGDPISDKVLRRRGGDILDAAQKRARNRLRRAADVDPADPHDPELVHRARKALKRLRYTAEVLGPVLPRAKQVARRAKRLQDRLGNHQDLMVELAFLRHLASVLGSREGHNAFTYGVLLVRAEHDAELIRQRRTHW